MHVLIIEDEEKIARVLVDYFRLDGFDCDIIDDGDRAVDAVRLSKPDFVILDLMLPGKDGLTICRELRAFSDVPILILTAKVEEIDRLLGLELGADDYVCKPFSPREVLARTKNILRRVNAPRADAETPLAYRDIRLLPKAFKCVASGREIDLTPVEVRILELLIGAPGRVFSRRQLIESAYDDGRVVSERTVDSHIKNLRRKLFGDEQGLIRSIYGVGYKLE